MVLVVGNEICYECCDFVDHLACNDNFIANRIVASCHAKSRTNLKSSTNCSCETAVIQIFDPITLVLRLKFEIVKQWLKKSLSRHCH